MSSPKLPTGWSVTGTAETTDVDATGKFVKGILVSFHTTGGHDGSVFLPVDQATPDRVRAVIEARVAQLDDITALTGGAE